MDEQLEAALLALKVVFDKRLRYYSDIEHLIRAQKLTKVSDQQREMLRRAERSGRTLYATINPYQSEMGCGETVQPRELLLAQSQEELDETFHRLMAEI